MRLSRASVIIRCAASLALSAAALFMSVAPAAAADWYFSDCATGGSGTIGSPYCLDPGRDGVKDSFEYLANGSGPEAAAGDTIYLCAGACDGAGSGTYRVSATGNETGGRSYFFDPQAGGTSSAPITLRPYCSSSGCETVTISGDTDGDGSYDSNEPVALVSNTTTAAAHKGWIVFQGDPRGTGARHLRFEKSGGNMFSLRDDPQNWTFDGVQVSKVDARTWAGGSVYPNGCTGDGDGYAWRVHDLTGRFTIRNSAVHTVCKTPFRFHNNEDTRASFMIEGNEVSNCGQTGAEFWASRNGTFRGNTITDCKAGISVEDRARNVVIEDNTIACLGDSIPSADGRCYHAILVSDGDNGSTYAGMTQNVTIRRNRVYSRNRPGASASPYTNRGVFLGGIGWIATCDGSKGCTATGGVIENNMIWRVQSPFAGHAIQRGAIDVSSNRPVLVQNNTIYDSRFGIQINGVGGDVAHAVRNNLVINSLSEGLFVYYPSRRSTVSHNNFDDTSGNVMAYESGASYTCGNVGGGLGFGNKCARSALLNVLGDVASWDLHLAPADTANREEGEEGPSDDIDRQARGGTGCEIGADEVGEMVVDPPTATLRLAPEPPAWNGRPLLKAGSWQVTLTTSRPVVRVPSTLAFADSGGALEGVALDGKVPGTEFTGTLAVDGGVRDGDGAFRLSAGALDDGFAQGSAITTGAGATIDRTPPAAPGRPAIH